MEAAGSSSVYPATSKIPVDLFVSKKHPGLTRGEVGFGDASGNIVFRVDLRSPKLDLHLHPHKRVLLDSSGNSLISMCRDKNGSWQGYKGNDSGENEELLFRVERTLNRLNRTELEVFLADENRGDSKSDFKVMGFPFQKSCTIYRGNAIVAQTSLMYKLNQVFVKRGKFRLTIFPGFDDHPFVAALIVIFVYGRKY